MDDTAVLHYLKQLSTYLDAFCKDKISQGELTASQSFCIAYLLRHNAEDGICPTDLCDVSGASRPAISVLLKGLKKKGYLEMTGDANDDRKKHIVLTPKAYEYEQEMLEDMKRTKECLCRGISEDDMRTTEHSLCIMVENLKQESKRRNDL